MDRASVWRQVQQQHHQQASGGGGGGTGAAGHAVVAAAAGASATPPCRPTGARWTPTQEQVKILKELYYGCGIRSPNTEQIQRIAARLRQFGRIEGKNVFYWFQNHKARERHKKRLGVVTTSPAGDASAGYLGVLSPGSGAAAAASYGGMYGSGNGGGGSAVQMDGSTTTTCWEDSNDADKSFVQLQDYMGVMKSSGAGNHGSTAPTRWPACFSFSADQTPTREPETLPLFPTGGQHGGGSNGSYLHSNSSSNFHSWGPATTTTNNTMTFQQQHHHQLQDQQYNFYSNQQLMMMPSQDAGTSLELTLSSPYPAGFM